VSAHLAQFLTGPEQFVALSELPRSCGGSS
jgi:hypothetical protein